MEKLASDKQKEALQNKCRVFGIRYIEPITSKDASSQFKRVDSLIAQKSLGLTSSSDEDDMFFEHQGIDDYLDPIF